MKFQKLKIGVIFRNKKEWINKKLGLKNRLNKFQQELWIFKRTVSKEILDFNGREFSDQKFYFFKKICSKDQ